MSSGAFWHYLSGPAAVATAGEEIAAAHADGRPHRDSMRVDKIAQFRYQAVSQGVRRFGKRSPPEADEYLQKPHNTGSQP
jgi:hypothetical protein